jgi:hypothetical protein
LILAFVVFISLLSILNSLNIACTFASFSLLCFCATSVVLASSDTDTFISNVSGAIELFPSPTTLIPSC